MCAPIPIRGRPGGRQSGCWPAGRPVRRVGPGGRAPRRAARRAAPHGGTVRPPGPRRSVPPTRTRINPSPRTASVPGPHQSVPPARISLFPRPASVRSPGPHRSVPPSPHRSAPPGPHQSRARISPPPRPASVRPPGPHQSVSPARISPSPGRFCTLLGLRLRAGGADALVHAIRQCNGHWHNHDLLSSFTSRSLRADA
jgi:hypothetical protein